MRIPWHFTACNNFVIIKYNFIEQRRYDSKALECSGHKCISKIDAPSISHGLVLRILVNVSSQMERDVSVCNSWIAGKLVTFCYRSILVVVHSNDLSVLLALFIYDILSISSCSSCVFTLLVLIWESCAAFIDSNNKTVSEFSDMVLLTIEDKYLSSVTIGELTTWMVADANALEAIADSGIDDKENICWNSNSSTTSNTLDFLLTSSAQQARLLFVWTFFHNHSCCDLNYTGLLIILIIECIQKASDIFFSFYIDCPS